MKKEELVKAIASNTGITKTQSRKAIEMLINSVTNSLKEGKEFKLKGLGTFFVSIRKKRIGRNPKTGELIKIPVRRFTKFKPSKALKVAVRGRDDWETP